MQEPLVPAPIRQLSTGLLLQIGSTRRHPFSQTSTGVFLTHPLCAAPPSSSSHAHYSSGVAPLR